LIYLVIGCIILAIIVAIIYIICALYHCRQLTYVQSNNVPVEYHLLSNNQGTEDDFVISDSEDEEDRV